MQKQTDFILNLYDNSDYGLTFIVDLEIPAEELNFKDYPFLPRHCMPKETETSENVPKYGKLMTILYSKKDYNIIDLRNVERMFKTRNYFEDCR